jgi:hypothetical protein
MPALRIRSLTSVIIDNCRDASIAPRICQAAKIG